MRLVGACVCVVVLALLGGLGVPLRAVAAAPPGPSVTMSVQTGYAFAGGGNYRIFGPSLDRAADAWAPIHITLRNSGPDRVDGRVVISDNNPPGPAQFAPIQADYALDVSLPPGADKLVEMYVRGADLQTISTADFEVAGKVVASSPIAASPQPGDVISVGVLSDDTATRPLLRSIALGGTTLSVTQFDNTASLDAQPQALANFDLIVLANFSTDTLSAAQLRALREWVEGGGVLLEAGGQDVQKTLAPLPAALQAAVPASSGAVALEPSLPELSGPAGDATLSTGPAAISVAAPRAGARVIVRHGAIPLVVDMRLGRGHIVYSALEPAQAPLAGWPIAAQGQYWWHMLAPALGGPLDALVQSYMQGSAQPQSGAGGFSSILGDIGALPTRTLPSLQIYAFAVVLYILLLGPVNFLLLRRLRRLEFSWVTLPVAALVFGAASFGLATARNGVAVTANVDTLVYLDGNGPTKLADSFEGIFDPNDTDHYTVSAAGPGLAWGGGDSSSGPFLNNASSLSVDEGSPLRATISGVPVGSLGSLVLRQEIPLAGGISAHLVWRGGTVAGSVTNGTTLELRDCVVAGVSGSSAVIPALGPHQTATIAPFNPGAAGLAASSFDPYGQGSGGGAAPSASFSTQGGSGAVAPADALSPARLAALLNGFFPSGAPVDGQDPLAFIGWSTQSLAPLSVDGSSPRRSDLDLVMAPLDPVAAPGVLTIAPGSVPLSVLGTTVAPSLGSFGSITLSPGDHLDLQLQVPLGTLHMAGRSMAIRASQSDGSTLPPGSTALWDWSTGQWRSIDLSSGAWSSTHAASLLSPDGRVWLRIAPTQASVSLSNLAQNVGIGASGTVRP